MTKIKICGITNYRDAAFSVFSGADLLGFIFYKNSLRCILPAKAKAIVQKLPKNVLKVGVFVNEAPEKVKKIADACGLDLLQFHGDESPEYLSSFKDYRTMKAFRVKGKLSLKVLMPYKADFFLFDTYQKDTFGGTGKAFDWGMLKPLKKIKTPFFVSGGLTPDNVCGLIKKIRPFGVDVSSGVEKSPGKKDLKSVKAFIDAAREG
ncbi:MAG TPA: phosphoribosylanthranilate isomerase [Candidatus Omnitrophica bacterium]|nr:phosphoribosylanthranilate isomerase [Candidatus Omnitrophota bacterium]